MNMILKIYIYINAIHFGLSGGKKKNKTDEETVQRFNGNPNNCKDMLKLDYTLNGFYIVNLSHTSERFGVVFCQFKLPKSGGNKSIHIRNQNYFGWFLFYTYINLLFAEL